jgi:hypothetical protein
MSSPNPKLTARADVLEPVMLNVLMNSPFLTAKIEARVEQIVQERIDNSTFLKQVLPDEEAVALLAAEKVAFWIKEGSLLSQPTVNKDTGEEMRLTLDQCVRYSIQTTEQVMAAMKLLAAETHKEGAALNKKLEDYIARTDTTLYEHYRIHKVCENNNIALFDTLTNLKPRLVEMNEAYKKLAQEYRMLRARLLKENVPPDPTFR